MSEEIMKSLKVIEDMLGSILAEVSVLPSMDSRLIEIEERVRLIDEVLVDTDDS